MSYRKRYDFTQPSADELIENRRKMMWLYPLYFLQPGFWIFDADASFEEVLFSAILWAVMLVALLWILVGLPMRWMSERDQVKMDDEWNRYATGDACKWGMAALGAMTVGASFLNLWLPLDADRMLYSVTNGAIFTALCRLAWLSRDAGDDEDE
jgi:hypothetical protein